MIRCEICDVPDGTVMNRPNRYGQLCHRCYDEIVSMKYEWIISDVEKLDANGVLEDDRVETPSRDDKTEL